MDNPAINDLANALLQLEQSIESKYLSPPLGEHLDFAAMGRAIANKFT